MHHRVVSTRIATSADVTGLAALWNELRQIGDRAERAVNPLTVADAEQRFAAVVDSPDADVLIAYDGDDIAGCAVVRVVQPDPLSPTRVLQFSNAVVAARHRRRGIGHSLVGAAADYADRHGVDHVAAGVYPSLREASRFFARLGFAPVLLERVAPVTVLQRRLAPATNRLSDERARRRRLRAAMPSSRHRAGTRIAD